MKNLFDYPDSVKLPLSEPPAIIEIHQDSTQNLIFFKGELMYTIAQTDKVQMRFVAVQFYLANNINQSIIAASFKVSRNAFNVWVQSYRKGGLAGLESRQGKQVKLTEAVKSRIIQLTKEKVSRYEIARELNIDIATVSKFRKKHREESAPMLCPEIDWLNNEVNTEPAPPIEEPALSVEEQNSAPVTTLDDEILLIDNDQVTGNLGAPTTPRKAELSSDTELASLVAPSNALEFDPLNRSDERMLASVGLLNDAKPIFAECEHVENAGALLAVAMLSQDCFMPVINKVYRCFGSSFYGLRNTFMCFFLMAILRLKNIHSIEAKHGVKLGRLLGLDRSPCSKTLRRKLFYLTSRNQALEAMNLIAQERINEYDNDALGVETITLYLDGHIHKYSGKEKFSKTFSTSKNRVVKGASDYYLNLPDGSPLLIIPTDFNQSMFEMMASIIIEAKKICCEKRLTIVFDRGGSSAKTYELILNLDCDFIAYHKNPNAIDPKLFKKENCMINGQKYMHKPYDHEIELEVKERRGAIYKKTGRLVKVREVVVLRDDDNKQTSILTSRRDIPSEVIATTIFQRWTQENYFKYGLEHYNIDAMCTYKTLEVEGDIDRPNPEYKEATDKIGNIRKKMTRIMRRPNEKLIEKEFNEKEIKLSEIYSSSQQQKLIELAAGMRTAKEFRKGISKRIKAEDYRKFNDEARLVSNLVKMAAYNIEGKMARVFKEVSKYRNGSERGVIKDFTHTTGAITIEGENLMICLEQQSTPGKSAELQAFCAKINELEAVYPGSDLIMKFSVSSCHV